MNQKVIAQGGKACIVLVGAAFTAVAAYFTGKSRGHKQGMKQASEEYEEKFKKLAGMCDEAMGSVSGGKDYAYGTPATLEAVPNEGYHFVKWSDDNTENPRTLMVTEDIELTAIFAKDETDPSDPSDPDDPSDPTDPDDPSDPTDPDAPGPI